METRIENVLRSCCNDFFRILSVLSIFQCAFRPGSNKRLKSFDILHVLEFFVKIRLPKEFQVISNSLEFEHG